jgi:methylenetetrahydrofolate reductase (NADPH)
MRVDEIIATTYPCISVEFFPPKTEEGEKTLWETVEELKRHKPAFVSVTYGAGGSTRDRTVEIVRKIREEHGMEAMAHFTCVEATVPELREVAAQIEEAGIENVLALRGDPPRGQEQWTATPGGLTNAAELAGLVSEDHDFTIGGACFPEVHPESPDLETDLGFLKQKIENGVSFLITQLFFEVDLYFDFVEAARDAGIEVPIIPGIMPIRSYEQITRFAALCGATIPDRLAEQMELLDGDPEAEFNLGLAFAAQQCSALLEGGAPGLHLYGLNRIAAVRALLGTLRAARPWERANRRVGAPTG